MSPQARYNREVRRDQPWRAEEARRQRERRNTPASRAKRAAYMRKWRAMGAITTMPNIRLR